MKARLTGKDLIYNSIVSAYRWKAFYLLPISLFVSLIKLSVDPITSRNFSSKQTTRTETTTRSLKDPSTPRREWESGWRKMKKQDEITAIRVWVRRGFLIKKKNDLFI